MDHANEVGQALRRAGADKLPPTATAYLYQRLGRGGVDLDRKNLGNLQEQGFGQPKRAASFPDLDAGARALVSTSFRAAPRAWGEATDDDLTRLGRYPLRGVALGKAIDPDDALKKFHKLTPAQAIAAGWTRVTFPGCEGVKPGWAAPGSNAPIGPIGPPDRIPMPVRDGGIAYLSFANAERAGAIRGSDGSWDLSKVKPLVRASVFAGGSNPQLAGVGKNAAYVAGGVAVVLVLTGIARAAFAPPDAAPAAPSQPDPAPPSQPDPAPHTRPTISILKRDEPAVVQGRIQADGSTIWEDGSKSYPPTPWNDPAGTWPWPSSGDPTSRLRGMGVQAGATQADGSVIWDDGSRTGGSHQREDAPGTWGWPPPTGGQPTSKPKAISTFTATLQQVGPVTAAPSGNVAPETTAQGHVSGIGDAPAMLPELDVTFRGLVADWEGFDRIGVGAGVLPDLAQDAATWRTFRDAWRTGTLPPGEIVPRLEAETVRATRVRQALRDAAIVDPSLQLAASASNAKAWIDTIPWLAWVLKPGAGALGAWRVPLVLGGIVVGLMLLSAIIKGRRGTKIYMLPPPKAG